MARQAWTWMVPAAGLALLALAAATGIKPWLTLLCGVGLIGAVLAAVHHAEVVAHRVGEPFGTLVLALAVTAIEVSLILSMMVAGGADAATLPRDTIYATIMIIITGVVGLCLLLGGIAHYEQTFHILGAGGGLAALIVMSALTLVEPDFTVTSGVGTYSTAQLIFVASALAVLWAVFVLAQTGRYRDYFLPVTGAGDESAHAASPSLTQAWASFGLLVVSLVAVVGLAKMLSPTIERAVERAGAPRAVVGIVIALLVLLPETMAAVRAALANRLQTSMNLALGSALASIGLTVPLVVIAALLLNLPLTLGLEAKDMALLAVAFLVSTISLGTGRTHMMQGAVLLVVFASFLVLALIP